MLFHFHKSAQVAEHGYGAVQAFSRIACWCASDGGPLRVMGAVASPLKWGQASAIIELPSAGVTQLVECLLPKQNVVGSSPITRSKKQDDA